MIAVDLLTITWLGVGCIVEVSEGSSDTDGSCSILRRFEPSNNFALSSVDDKRFLDFVQVC
jgi:hypothetical protein